MAEYARRPDHRCPTCNSPSPGRHPAMAWEGEVEICSDAYHLIQTNENRPQSIAAVREKRAAKGHPND